MYQALYRKWRPRTFDEVVGQEHITETLKNQVKHDRLSHAYLFIGTRGTGKTTCARILARAVNCENPVNGNPCGKCAACRGILDGSILDVVELDAASNNGVDNVRALREEAVFSPTVVRKRVYIIDEVHMLSLAAFNALLKILEEPPAHLMFILATTELQKVPATILSRCQRHSFRRIDTEKITAYLEYIADEEHFQLEHEAAELIARMADGGVRDALSLLDQCSAHEKIDLNAVYTTMGLAGNRRIAELLHQILQHDTDAVLRGFSSLWMDGKDPATLLGELNGLMRDVLLMHVAPKSAGDLLSGGYDSVTLQSFARQMTTEELLSAMNTVQRALGSLRETGNPKMAAELCLVSLCDDTAGERLDALRARVSRLEELAARGIPMAGPAPETEYPEEALEPTEGEEEPENPIGREELTVSPRSPKAKEMPVQEAQRPEKPDRQPAAETPVPEQRPVSALAGSWKEIRDRAAGKLPMDLQVVLKDENIVRGQLTDTELILEVVPGFRYNRFNKQEILGVFAAAAQESCGRALRVRLTELKQEERAKRSLEDLKGFKEVHFIQ